MGLLPSSGDKTTDFLKHTAIRSTAVIAHNDPPFPEHRQTTSRETKKRLKVETASER